MKYFPLLLLFMFISACSRPQSLKILDQSAQKLKKLDKVKYRSVSLVGGMGLILYSDGEVYYEKKNNQDRVYLNITTKHPMVCPDEQQLAVINQDRPYHSFNASNLSKTNEEMLMKMNQKHPFRNSNEVIFNGEEFIRHQLTAKETHIDFSSDGLRNQTHFLALDIIEQIKEEDAIISFEEGKYFYNYELKGYYPVGSFRDGKSDRLRGRKILLSLDKKSLLPVSLHVEIEMGMMTHKWMDYQYDQVVEEDIWDSDKYTDHEEFRPYQDENGIFNRYQLSLERVLYNGIEIKNCDPRSFKRLGSSHFRDDKHVYSGDKIIEGADPSTFNLGNGYRRDKNHVYSRGKIIVDADPKSFGLTDSLGKTPRIPFFYLKDTAYVYGRRVKIEGADVNSFELLKHKNKEGELVGLWWAKDKNRVYCLGREVKDADPLSIQAINHHHAKDNTHFFISGKLVKVDQASFVSYPNLMIKSKHGVYDKNAKMLKGADPETFTYLNEFYQKDGTKIFFTSKLFEKADYASFQITDEKNYAYDQYHVFHRGTKIEGVDIATWQLLSANYSKDKQTVYYQKRSVEGADAASFEVELIEKKELGKDKHGQYLYGTLVKEESIFKK